MHPCAHRYIVIPARPEGTEGWAEEQLMRLVTRDSMIGVAAALTPSQLAADDARASAAAAASAGGVGGAQQPEAAS
jgi:hypothetical protein